MDGQQRLRAIHDFADGAFSLGSSKEIFGELAGKGYDELDEEMQRGFLAYPVGVEQLFNASAEEVLDVFHRLNAYGLDVNPQELRHGKFQGAYRSTVIEAALERNADRPVILDVHELTSYADCLVIMSGNSNRQVRSIVDQVVKALKADGDIPLGVEGGDNATWMLIDSNDVIVHVFDPDARELFDLEALWGDAPRITLDMPELTPVEAAPQATTSVA
ncbi:MAG: ribosome silencing factor [Myxococcales bacterium]|nr:ribosome silencing factor [Myxococcales bacterium]